MLKKLRKLICVSSALMILSGGIFALPVKIVQAKSAYDYQFVSQSPYPSVAKPGDVINVWMEIKNTGTRNWYNSGANPVRLGSGSKYGSKNQERDYPSEFYVGQALCGGALCVGAPTGWLSQSRPVAISDQQVVPGGTTRFQLNIKAPAEPGKYRAYFTPVADHITWMNDIGIYWEIKVSRGYSYSFDYENVDNPTNAEVNKNTSTVVSPEQNLIIEGLKNQMSYKSIKNTSNIGISFKINKSVLDSNKKSINDTDKTLSEYGVPLSLGAQLYNDINLNFQTDETSINTGVFSNVYTRSKISVYTKDINDTKKAIFDSDIEAIANENKGVFSKFNQFDLVGDYFKYSKPGVWYGQVVDSNSKCLEEAFGFKCSYGSSGGIGEYNSLNQDLQKMLVLYPKAVARDLNRAGIVITKKGTDKIDGTSYDVLNTVLTKENVIKYNNITSEMSSMSQESLNQSNAIFEKYLDNAIIDVWVNPTTKMMKKVMLNLKLKSNETFDSFNLSYSYTVDAINDSALAVNVPTSFENMNKLDLIEKLQEKLSSTADLKAKIKMAGANLSSKVAICLQKASKYVDNIGR